jgi:hypothetical protein
MQPSEIDFIRQGSAEFYVGNANAGLKLTRETLRSYSTPVSLIGIASLRYEREYILLQ